MPDPVRPVIAPRRRRRPGARSAIVTAGLALAVGIGVFTLDAVDTEESAGSLADQVAAACATGGDAARQLQLLGACDQASAVQDDTTSPVLLGGGVDEARVIELVREELAATPTPAGQAPSLDALTAAARRVIEANPDLYRGPAPSVDVVREIVVAVIAADPGAFRGLAGSMGVQGERGEPGRGMVGSVEDPDDPCVRIVRYDRPPLVERWRTCAPPATDGGSPTTGAPTGGAEPGTEPEPPSTTPSTPAPPSSEPGGLFG